MKLTYLATEDWYFTLHWLPQAIKMRAGGIEVTVITRVAQQKEQIENAGIRVIPIGFKRRSLNPFQQFQMIWQLVRIYRQERPSVVHHIALKPILLGSIAARLAGVKVTINTLTGLGSVFVARELSAKILSGIVKCALVPILNRGMVVVQNPDDKTFLIESGVRAGSIRLIGGVGVDTEKFTPVEEPKEIPIVMLASRLLWDKGVGEFVEAARLLKKTGPAARFVLVGKPDKENPSAIPDEMLQSWIRDDLVEWWGMRNDMPTVLAMANIVCLPSYREGLPTVLLEAAACGRAIITTDVPGCREVVKENENGMLIPLRDSVRLAAAIRTLLEQPETRRRMGQSGRNKVVTEFSLDRIVEQTLDVYRECI